MGRRLAATIVFAHPKIAAVARCLEETLFGGEEVAAPSGEPTGLQVIEMDNVSDAQVLELLEAELQQPKRPPRRHNCRLVSVGELPGEDMPDDVPAAQQP